MIKSSARKSFQRRVESHVGVPASSLRIYVNYIDWFPSSTGLIRFYALHFVDAIVRAKTLSGAGTVFRRARHREEEFSDRFRKKGSFDRDFESKRDVLDKGRMNLEEFYVRFFFLEYIIVITSIRERSRAREQSINKISDDCSSSVFGKNILKNILYISINLFLFCLLLK